LAYKFTKQVSLLSEPTTTTGTVYAVPQQALPWLYTAGNYDGTIQVFLEVDWYISNVSYTAYCALYTTGGSVVSGSEITTQAGTAVANTVRSRSGDIFSQLADATGYQIEIKSSNASGTVNLRNARLIIQQSGAVTKTETIIELMGPLMTTAGTSYADITSAVAAGSYTHSTMNLDGTLDVRFEAVARVANATRTCTIGLHDGSNNLISTAECVASTTPYNQRIRYANAVTLVNGTSYKPRIKTSVTTASTGVVYCARLIIAQTGAWTKTQCEFPIHKLASTTTSLTHSTTDQPFLLTLADFTGDVVAYYFESIGKIANATATCSVELCKDDGTVIDTRTHTATINSKSRGAALDLSTYDGATLEVWIKTSATTRTATLYLAKLIVVTSRNFNDRRQSIIDGLDSAQSEAHGWDAEVKAKIPVTNVVRTSDTVVTITLSAESAYDITAQETITVTVPALVLIGGSQIVATPTFTVDTAGAATRELLAAIAAASTTPNVAETTTRAILANIAGASTTADIAASITRALLAGIAAGSTTADVSLPVIARALITTLSVLSGTPDIGATSVRAIIAAIAASSLTPDAQGGLIRSLVAAIPGSSLTPDISASILRSLIAAIPGSSLTPDVAITIARALIANIAAGSFTPDITITLPGVISLIAAIAGTSTTADIAATNVRAMLASIAAGSVTPDISVTTIRSLLTNIAASSITPDITATISGLISLAAAIAGTSITPDIAASISRSLSAIIAGQSVTPDISVNISRALSASVFVQSLTPDIISTTARNLLASIQGTSITPDDLILILGGLGVIIDPTIESITPRRTFGSVTPVRTFTSTTPRRSIHNA
jgi:hypothetical protein